MASGEARGLVPLPAGVRHRARKQHPVAENDPGVGRCSRISTGYSWEGNQRPTEVKRENVSPAGLKTAITREELL